MIRNIFIPDHALDKETGDSIGFLTMQLCEKGFVGQLVVLFSESLHFPTVSIDEHLSTS
jgi:hypothetical protein